MGCSGTEGPELPRRRTILGLLRPTSAGTYLSASPTSTQVASSLPDFEKDNLPEAPGAAPSCSSLPSKHVESCHLSSARCDQLLPHPPWNPLSFPDSLAGHEPTPLPGPALLHLPESSIHTSFLP